MVTELMQAFNVHALSLGALSAYFYYAYVSMQIPVGSLMDKFGPHRLLTVTAALCALGCFLFAQATDLRVAEAGRFLMGFGAAFAFVGALKLATIWFSPTRFGLLAGITQALGMLGAAVGEGPVSMLVTQIGWRNTMWAIGGVLCLIAALIGLLVRDRPHAPLAHHLPTPPISAHHELSLLKGLKVVLRNPQTWINGAVIGFLYAPTAAFAELWGVSYIRNVYGIDTDIAASAISMIFIGWGIASPVGGWISDRIKLRKPVIIGSIVASLVFMSLVLYLPHMPIALLFGLLFLYGMSNIGVATCYAVACEFNPKRVAGTSMGFTNMASVIVGAAFQPVIGWLLDLNWDGVMLNGAPLFSADNFRHSVFVLPLCFIVCLIGVVFLKETHCQITE
jgi:sugar phosphate permease